MLKILRFLKNLTTFLIVLYFVTMAFKLFVITRFVSDPYLVLSSLAQDYTIVTPLLMLFNIQLVGLLCIFTMLLLLVFVFLP